MKRCDERAYDALRTMGACFRGLRLVRKHGWKKAWDLADDEETYWVWEQLSGHYPPWLRELKMQANEDFEALRRGKPLLPFRDVFRRPTVAELEWCARQVREERREA